MTARLHVAAALAALVAGSVAASDCDQTTIGLTPLNDLGPALYLGQFAGGLYPGGAAVPPPAHASEGLARAAAIRPRNADGDLDPGGAYVLLSVGLSNATQEFCSREGTEPCDPWTFMGRAAQHPLVARDGLVIANGARGGQPATAWDEPDDANWDRVRDTVLAPKGLTEAQVQVLWVKQANPGPQVSLPSPDADAFELEATLGDIARAAKMRYPNLQMIFLSSRIYAGYASTPLNPEPFAYESGFSVKWLIEAQISQMAGGGIDPVAGDLEYNGTAPWLAWGPYPWADGLTPRGDGLAWACEEFEPDGTHPALDAEQKVGRMLLDFFLGSPFTGPWFTDPLQGDLDGDGSIETTDLLLLIAAWGSCPAPCPPLCVADLDGDCEVGRKDLLMLMVNWSS